MTRRKLPISGSEDPRYAATFYLVEATDFEHLALWREEDERKQVRWEDGARMGQHYGGYLVTVGHVNRNPVCVSVRWDRIDGRLVLFYYTTSQLVDHRMVRPWLEKACPDAKHTNAMNFAHCIHEIQRANGVRS